MGEFKSVCSASLAAVVALAFMAGCETSPLENEGTVSLSQLQGYTPPVETPSSGTDSPSSGTTSPGTTSPGTSTSPSTGTTTPGTGYPAEITGPIKWLHNDVSSWPVTASLSASVGGGTISMPYSKSKVWPAVDGVNANPWVIVNLNGQWYAATFEWFRHGQTSKPVGVLNGSMGDHIKVSPLNAWRPRSGERIGLMVSGLARAQSRNVRERSNIVMVTWP